MPRRKEIPCPELGLPHVFAYSAKPAGFLQSATLLRIGAATTAASVAPVSTLKAMGRWSSSAYERYLRPEAQAILDAQKAMSAL